MLGYSPVDLGKTVPMTHPTFFFSFCVINESILVTNVEAAVCLFFELVPVKVAVDEVKFNIRMI